MSLSKSRWRSIASSWRWCERHTRKPGGKPIAFSHGGFQPPLLAAYGKAEEILRRPHRAHAGAYPLQCRIYPPSSWIQDPENGGRIIGELCHFVDWARAVVGCPMQTLTAAALPDAGATTAITLRSPSPSRTDPWQICCTLPMGTAPWPRNISRYSAEVVSRALMTSRLSISPGTARRRHSKGGRDKGHRREMELTIEAMKQGKDAPIPFEELLEVTEATFAVEEAIRTQRTDGSCRGPNEGAECYRPSRD